MKPAQRPGTVAIETHGCKLNTADSQALARRFVAAGFRVVDPEEPADVYVLNTCTVTHVADRKARRALRSASRRNPEALLVATGCYAERASGELSQTQDGVLVLGNRDKGRLVEEVMRLRGDGAHGPHIPETEGPGSGASLHRTRAAVKIQEGCNQVCAYCIVPRVRGRERSIPPDVLVAQVQEKAEQGYSEVVLTGTQLGSYGFELDGVTLGTLLQRLLQETEIPRLRVSSLQPQEIDTNLLDLWEDPRLCRHFHIPLQSGSDTVLKRMRRRYTAAQYAAAVERIWNRYPEAAITSDVLVGLPGETEGEAEETYALCERLPLASLHIFPYSRRPGTSAAYFRDTVNEQLQGQRVHRLLALATEKQAVFLRSLQGTVRPVLWESQTTVAGIRAWKGLTDNHARVLTPAETDLSGHIVPTRLDGPPLGAALWGSLSSAQPLG